MKKFAMLCIKQASVGWSNSVCFPAKANNQTEDQDQSQCEGTVHMWMVLFSLHEYGQCEDLLRAFHGSGLWGKG